PAVFQLGSGHRGRRRTPGRGITPTDALLHPGLFEHRPRMGGAAARKTIGGKPMTRPNGIHHFAICTADIKAQIAYFTDVLGMELVALYWMHGVEGAWHGFLRLNDQS